MFAWKVLCAAFLPLCVQSSSTNNNPKNFMSLSADCLQDRILVTLDTLEPFYGLLYSRNHPSTCRIGGNGHKRTSMDMLQLMECGIDTKVNGDRQVDIYIQHDSFVQQVIDEQFLVRCSPGVHRAHVSYHNRQKIRNRNKSGPVRDVTVTSKLRSSRREIEAEKRLNPKVAHLVDSNLDVVAEAPVWVEKKHEDADDDGDEDEFEEGNESTHSEPDSGWMEMIWQRSEGDPVLSTGDNVTLVIRLRQAENHDTMLSSCMAFSAAAAKKRLTGGNDDGTRDLTDYRGCSLDEHLMPNFQASFNSQTGIKALKTRLSLISFDDENRLRGKDQKMSSSAKNPLDRFFVKCNVLVCRKNCPLYRCDGDEKFDSGAIIDKFLLQTHVDIRNVGSSSSVNPPQPLLKLKKEEIDEAEEAYIEQQLLASDYDGGDNANEGGDDDESLLCLSPSRVILAFGILLFILLLALVFACMLWMRARSRLQRPAVMRRPAKPIMPGHPPPPPPMRPRGGPILMQARGGLPYIRVMQ